MTTVPLQAITEQVREKLLEKCFKERLSRIEDVFEVEIWHGISVNVCWKDGNIA